MMSSASYRKPGGPGPEFYALHGPNVDTVADGSGNQSRHAVSALSTPHEHSRPPIPYILGSDQRLNYLTTIRDTLAIASTLFEYQARGGRN